MEMLEKGKGGGKGNVEGGLEIEDEGIIEGRGGVVGRRYGREGIVERFERRGYGGGVLGWGDERGVDGSEWGGCGCVYGV